MLRAYYQKAGTTFDLAPASVPVKVAGGSVAVDKPFQVPTLAPVCYVCCV